MSDIEFQRGVIRPIECYKEAWELIKKDYWLLLLVVLAGAMIGGATLYLLIGAMTCGIIYCYLQVIDGNEFSFSDLFKGFNYWLPGLIVALFFIVPMLILYGIVYIPPLIAITSNPNILYEDLLKILFTSVLIDSVFAIFMVCLHTLLLFAFPLIVDKNLSAFEAMKLSAKSVWANLGGVAGLFGIGFLVGLAGMLVFCIGVYLVMPISVGAGVVAFRKVFPKQAT